MNELEQLLLIVNEMRKNSDYSILDNVPDELLKNKEDRNKITKMVYSQLAQKNNFLCLYPNCKNKPIRSHSIQKALLKDIVDNTNHLTKISIEAEFKINGKIKAVVEHPSINEASTFEGYCNTHDTLIFLPIEQGTIDSKNDEHNFLLLYRSVVREYFQSRKAYFLMRDIIITLTKDMAEENVMGPFLLIQLYLQFCEYFRIEKMKETLDTCYTQKIYNYPFTYKHICINKQYPVFVNTFFVVQGIKNGKVYRKDITKDLPLYCSLTMIPNNGKTDIYYAVLAEQETELQPLFEQLKETNSEILEENISDIILRNSDNFFISTEYWNSIPENNRNEILDFYLRTTSNREYMLQNHINILKYQK